MDNESVIPRLFGSISFLARRVLSELQMFMRSKRCLIKTFFLILFGFGRAYAFTQVTLSTGTPTQVEETFVEWTTTYFQATRIDNPLVANTHTIKLFGIQQKPPLSGSSASDAIAQGFSDGMDAERIATLKQIQAFQNVDFSSGTCAGLIVSTASAQNCQFIYNSIGNAIEQRWLQVYTSTGGIVAP